jgi:hypothetical protein
VGTGKASLRDVSGSARRADGSWRSDHADFPITPKISFRSSKLVFKKPCLEFGVRQATNFISVCQKNFASSVENLEARQAKRIISGVPAYVEAPISDHHQEAGPALPESTNSKNNKDKAGQTYESQQGSDQVHVPTPLMNPTLH